MAQKVAWDAFLDSNGQREDFLMPFQDQMGIRRTAGVVLGFKLGFIGDALGLYVGSGSKVKIERIGGNFQHSHSATLGERLDQPLSH